LLVGLLGGLIGASLSKQTVAPPPQIIQTAAPAPVPSTSDVADQSITPEWSADKDGWTVALDEFDKETADSAEVTKLKAEATGKGLDAGVIDSDDFSDLDSGNYIVYSGQFKSKKQAKKELKKAKAAGFDGAKVIHVTNGDEGSGTGSAKKVDRSELEDLERLSKESPEKAAKERLKLPNETAVPGKPPPSDDKKPGAGSETETIG